MEVDIRKHGPVREDVRVGIAALRVQGRQIWGHANKWPFTKVLQELMLHVQGLTHGAFREGTSQRQQEIKLELGCLILSTVRWIDDLGFDPLECLDLAAGAQELMAKAKLP